MNTTRPNILTLHIPATLLVLLCTLTPVRAEEEPMEGHMKGHMEGRSDESTKGLMEGKLVADVARSPLDLRQAVERAEGKQRVALRAAFSHDRRGLLLLRVLLRSTPLKNKKEGRARAGLRSEPGPGVEEWTGFEEWQGTVYDGCWVPRRRILSEPEELAEARRVSAFLPAGTRTLAQAITSSRGPPRPDKSSPGLALSIELTRTKGQVRSVALVAVDEQLRRVTQVLASAETVSSLALAPSPPRIEVDGSSFASGLPLLSVPGGLWFQAPDPPTLAGWRGQPVLVAVTDPG